MLEVRPIEVFEQVWPRPKVLLPGHNIQFSNRFPDGLDHVKGKTFRITKTAQVNYELSWILPELHYKDINLSNEDAGEKLYPEATDEVYETLIGFKPGNYFTLIYFPADQPIYRLGYYSMTPLIASASLKYLGAVKPEDSPVGTPTLKLYTVYKLKPFIFRISIDNGVEYEKITWVITINKCKLETVPAPVEPVKYIPYIDELKW